MEKNSSKMEPSSKDTIKIIKNKERENSFGLMETHIMDNSGIIKDKEKVL